jgi:hypothetical protein
MFANKVSSQLFAMFQILFLLLSCRNAVFLTSMQWSSGNGRDPPALENARKKINLKKKITS